MNVIPYAAERLPTKPRLKNVVVAVPASGDRVALRRGSDNDDILVQDKRSGTARVLLALLDGTRDLLAVVAAAHDAGVDTSAAEITRFIADLDAWHLLDDAAATEGPLSDGQRQRYSRNLNCWSATVH